MSLTVVPCVTVSTPEDYKESLQRIHTFAQRIHVDISDGLFAPNKLIDPTNIWWPQEWTTDVHAMVTAPGMYVDTLIAIKPHMIVFHVEVKTDLLPIIQKIKASGIKA